MRHCGSSDLLLNNLGSQRARARPRLPQASPWPQRRRLRPLPVSPRPPPLCSKSPPSRRQPLPSRPLPPLPRRQPPLRPPPQAAFPKLQNAISPGSGLVPPPECWLSPRRPPFSCKSALRAHPAPGRPFWQSPGLILCWISKPNAETITASSPQNSSRAMATSSAAARPIQSLRLRRTSTHCQEGSMRMRPGKPSRGRRREEAEQATRDFANAKRIGSIASYQRYLDTWPGDSQVHAEEARNAIHRLQDEERNADDKAWEMAKKANNIRAWTTYLEGFPRGAHREQAEERKKKGRSTRCCHHDGFVTSVAFLPDGKRVLSASADKTIKLWNTNGTLLKTFSGHRAKINSIAISPDGQKILSGGADQTIRLWDLEQGAEQKKFPMQDKEINSVAFSPDGQWICRAIARE